LEQGYPQKHQNTANESGYATLTVDWQELPFNAW